MWGVLVQALIAALVALLPRILAGIGVFFVADSVSTPIFNWLQNQIFAQGNGLPPDVLNALQFSGIYDGVIIIITAYTTVLAIKAGKTAFAAR